MMKHLMKCIFNKRMTFSVDESGHDVTVNLLERVKQKRKELKEIQDK